MVGPIYARRWIITKLTARMLASTPDFHYMRLLGFLAVFTTVLAALFWGAITSRMCAFCLALFLSHYRPLSEVDRGKSWDDFVESC